MKSVIIKLTEKSFVRNVTAIASGTALAQAITFLFTPIITRIYGPEALGVLGVFNSIVSIITPLAALSYPVAIVLPKSNEESKGIVYISIYISLFISISLITLIYLFQSQIVNIFQISEMEQYLYLIPLVIIVSTILQILEQWLIRTKQFKTIGKVAVIQSLFINSSKVGFGYIAPLSSTLVALTSLGGIFHSLFLIVGNYKSKFRFPRFGFDKKKLKELAYRYRDFPLYRTPQIFLNSISLSLPILLLSSFFGPASAGFYTISKSVLGVPSQLIGKAVGDVFYPRFSKAVHNNEDFTRLLINTTHGLALIGILPFGLIVAFGPYIFEFVFGPEWIMAGEYVRWIALWSFFSFINRPSVNAIPVLKLQGQFLIYELISIVTRFLTLFFGFYFLKSDIHSIIIFSIVSAILNLSLIIFTIIKSKKKSSILYS